MVETLQSVYDFLAPHWPAIAFTLIMSVLAQAMKTRIFTPGLAAQSKTIFWLRRLFPVILLLIGVAVGAVWPGETSPGISDRAHKIMYFTGCSGASIVLFNIVKQWIKKKYDIDLGFGDEKGTGSD